MNRMVFVLSLIVSNLAFSTVKLSPAYDLKQCPKITDLNVLGSGIYQYKKDHSMFTLSGESAVKTLIQILSPWAKSFEQSGDLVFKFRDLNLCVGMYDDVKSPNAFAYKTQFVMMGIAMAAQLEDVPDVEGKTAIQLVMAHEFGHFIQNQFALEFNYTLPMLSTKVKESHADCLAGMMLTYFENYNFTQMSQATKVLLGIADPHIIGDHGTEEQRRQALWYGVAEGMHLRTSQKKSVTAWDMVESCGRQYAYK